MDTSTTRIMVYSHDAYGLGNIRRMLSVCEYLLKAIPKLSILLLSGSPMLQSFRLPPGLDYIKLPGLSRDINGDLSNQQLGLSVEITRELRSEIALAAARNFQPHIFLVDKKPYGLRDELKNTVRYLKCNFPKTKLVLLLRDILDSPERVIKEWRSHHYFSALDLVYDQILVAGMPEVFDPRYEYNFPIDVAEKVKFCGYLRKPEGWKTHRNLRQELGIHPQDKLILVTPGGGADGYNLIKTYLESLEQNNRVIPFVSGIECPTSIIITGSEMSSAERAALEDQAKFLPRVHLLEFTNELLGYIATSNLVICMGGYNTVTEVLSQSKRAIVVPRTHPGHEQLLRAERFHELGLLHCIHPDRLNPSTLSQAIAQELQYEHLSGAACLDLQGLPRVAEVIAQILAQTLSDDPLSHYSSSGIPSDFLFRSLKASQPVSI